MPLTLFLVLDFSEYQYDKMLLLFKNNLYGITYTFSLFGSWRLLLYCLQVLNVDFGGGSVMEVKKNRGLELIRP